MIKWSEKYSVKIEILDQQHQHFFEILDELQHGLKTDSGKEVMVPILDELLRHAGEHFTAEEALMAAFAYPNLEMHKTEHQKLTERVHAFMSGSAEGDMLVGVYLVNFLREWVSHHILEIDMEYSNFLIAKGVAVGDLSETCEKRPLGTPVC